MGLRLHCGHLCCVQPMLLYSIMKCCLVLNVLGIHIGAMPVMVMIMISDDDDDDDDDPKKFFKSAKTRVFCN